jgi:hypothetical protein
LWSVLVRPLLWIIRMCSFLSCVSLMLSVLPPLAYLCVCLLCFLHGHYGLYLLRPCKETAACVRDWAAPCPYGFACLQMCTCSSWADNACVVGCGCQDFPPQRFHMTNMATAQSPAVAPKSSTRASVGLRLLSQMWIRNEHLPSDAQPTGLASPFAKALPNQHALRVGRTLARACVPAQIHTKFLDAPCFRILEAGQKI